MDRKTILMGASALVITVAGLPAYAQAPSAAAAGTPAQARVIEEVLVTARKREESLQDVPIAVTAASGEQLQRIRVDEPNDLARLAPSLQIGASPGGGATSVNITLRGQRAADTLLTVSQPVGIYLDGVNIPHPVGADASLFDLQRVEVLKGPQGTLYGRNTTGGAINFITRGADQNGVHGFIEGELSNYKGRRIAGGVNIPIMKDLLAARIVAQHWDRDGYARSIISGQTIGGNRNDDIVRVSLDFTPSDTLKAVAKYEYSKLGRGGLPYTNLYRSVLAPLLANPEANNFGGPAAVAQLAACTTTNPFLNCAELRQLDNVTTHHAVLDVDWQATDAIKVRSITGYHYFKNFRIFDLDGSPFALGENGFGLGGAQPNVGVAVAPPGALLPNGTPAPSGPFTIPVPFRPDQESGQFTQEFNVSGEYGMVTWLVGAFYSNDQGNGAQVTVRNPASAVRTAPFFAPSANTFDGLDIDSKTYAVFTQNDIKFTDQLSMTLGARYTEEKLAQNVSVWTYNQNFQSAVLPTISGPGRNFQCGIGPFAAATAADIYGPARPNTYQSTLEACAVHQQAKFHGTSYLASLNYKITPDSLLYAKISKGFRGGALQQRAPYVAPVEPETAKDFELGFKSQFFDRRVLLNLAAYRTNYTNQQQTGIEFVPGQPTTRTTVLRNASAARFQGFEAEWRIIPFDGLSVYGNYGYLDAKYRKWPNAPVALGNPAPATIDAAGLRIEIPKYTANVGARYELDAGPGRLGVQADVNIFSRTPLTALTNEALVPDSYEKFVRKGRQLVSARIDYEIPDMGLLVAVWATNLTNEHYQAATIPVAANGGLYNGLTREPRMYGVTLRKSFGGE
ncbi:MAG: hypothetical protein JWQ29_3338 [Phenylobacterium sp.]|nr:hypothetical protein [Phenylobacterium sp.]